MKEITSKNSVITNRDLFNEIIEKVKATGKWSDCIDYAISSNRFEGLYNYEFNPHFILRPGSNEGYYLDLEIYGNFSLEWKQETLSLGTIKTLDTSAGAVRKMAALYGECLIAYEAVVNENLDGLTRRGYDLKFLNDAGYKLHFGYSEISTMEKAISRFQEFHEKDPVKYHKAIIRDNLTRKEITIEA